MKKLKRLQQRLKNLQNGFERLKEAIEDLEEVTNDPDTTGRKLRTYQESLIQRFEFCYELIWKFLRDYLEEKRGIIAQTPRKSFHESVASGTLSLSESATLLDSSDSRNLTSHEYDEDLIYDISYKISHEYYPTMNNIITRLSKEL